MSELNQSWEILDKRRHCGQQKPQELAGNANISFEGELSKLTLAEVSGASHNETPVLKRNTLWPKQDFVVLPLEGNLTGRIASAIGGTLPKSLIHIQIEKNGRLELGLFDNFNHPRSIFLGPAVDSKFLGRLQLENIIRYWIE